MINDLATEASLIDSDDLPPRVGDLIKNLCSVVISQNNQIQNMGETFKQFSNESQSRINSLNLELKAAKSELLLANQEVVSLRDKIEKTKKQNEDQNVKKIAQIEETLKKLRSGISDNERSTLEMIERVDRKFQDDSADIRSMILELQQMPVEMPTTFANEDDRPKVVDGTVDISPLIRGLYRDSRRIDGLDELITTTRNECVEVIESVISMQDNLSQFNHNIHDLSLTDGKILSRVQRDANFLMKSIENNDGHFRELYKMVEKLSISLNHAVNITSDSIEQIESILTRMTNRALPSLPTLSDAQLEIFALKEEIHDKKALYDTDRRDFATLPENPDPTSVFKDVVVKKMEVKPRQTNMRTIIYGDNQQQRGNTVKQICDDAANYKLIQNLNENIYALQKRVADLEEKVQKLSAPVAVARTEVNESKSTERTLSKMETQFEKIAKRLQTLESSPRTIIVGDTTPRGEQTAPLTARGNLKEAPTTPRSTMSPRGTPVKTKPSYMTAPHSARKSRLASDNLGNRF